MSDSIKCDMCGTEGRRKIGKYVPDDWFYAEIDMDGLEAIIAACSLKCTQLQWHRGPGKLEMKKILLRM